MGLAFGALGGGVYRVISGFFRGYAHRGLVEGLNWTVQGDGKKHACYYLM